MVNELIRDGWQVFRNDPAIHDWLKYAGETARSIVERSPDHERECEGTWFVGVDALPNGQSGCIGGSGPLAGAAMAFLNNMFGASMPPLHPAQLSAIFPGYPRPRRGENSAAFRYREKRDAAHVDGLRATGANKRRYLKEPHAFVLGLAVTGGEIATAPLVVWKGSHLVMGKAFGRALKQHPPENWSDIDLTDIYQEARRAVFADCERVPLVLQPGDAVVLHRHALHGIAPWNTEAQAPEDYRLTAYFRPEFPNVGTEWLSAP